MFRQRCAATACHPATGGQLPVEEDPLTRIDVDVLGNEPLNRHARYDFVSTHARSGTHARTLLQLLGT